MQKSLKKTGTAILFAVLLTIPLFGQNFIINEYDFKGHLSKDNVMTVTEKISVDFTNPSHGIYREIPKFFEAKRYVNNKPKLLKYITKVTDFSVEEEPYTTENSSDYFTAIIGSKNVVLTGQKNYTIKYKYHIPDDRVQESDFIFYSVLGPDWASPIHNFNFEISLEKDLPQETDIIVYSGSLGAKDNNANVKIQCNNNTISGKAKNLSPKTAVTIFANLPENYFENPYKRQIILPYILAILSAFSNIILIFSKLFSSHKKPVKTVEFYPPKGIDSADVGFIIDNSAQDKDLLSLIPLWAHQGYITIQEVLTPKGKFDHLNLEKVKDLPQDASLASKTLFKALFEKSSIREFKNLDLSFGTSFDAAKALLKDKFTGDKKLYKGAGTAIIKILLLSILTGAFFAVSGTISPGMNIPVGFFISFMLLFFGIIRVNSAYTKNFKGKSLIAPSIIFFIITTGILSILIYTCISNTEIPLVLLIAVPAFTLFSLIFSSSLISMTDYNLELTGKLLGLKEFIKVAELQKLEMLIEKDPAYFYNILPYAIVFELTDKWIKNFKNISIPKPNWYKTNNTHLFNTIYLNRALNAGITAPLSKVRAAQNASKAASHAAASSSHAGGGFSGGGGGGGGGGSW